MKAKRVACLTYHKYTGADWAEEEFSAHAVQLAGRRIVQMLLDERGTCLSNGLWVREFRKRSERGHQTAILCTDYRSEAPLLAAAMFARWPLPIRPSRNCATISTPRKRFSLARICGWC